MKLREFNDQSRRLTASLRLWLIFRILQIILIFSFNGLKVQAVRNFKIPISSAVYSIYFSKQVTWSSSVLKDQVKAEDRSQLVLKVIHYF